MEFGFSPEQEKFKNEVREFFMNELPADNRMDHRHDMFLNEKQLAFGWRLQQKAGAKGYLAPGWSKEEGGLGLGDIEHGISGEESGYWNCTWPTQQGLRVCGPPLHVFGTPEQKKKFLPSIAQGKMVWYQTFTEPNAGSDEANMQLRAIQDGDYFVLNGQKTFITAQSPADYLYTLARTKDVLPKHRGLSLFLIDAHTKGISYRPLPTIGVFTIEIFFDDVRIHKDSLLGELNRGFYHAMETFAFERTGTIDAGRARRHFEELVQYCKDTKRNGKPLIQDPEVRKMLAEMAMEERIEWLCSWHGQWYLTQKEKLGAQPYNLYAIFKKTFLTKHAEEESRMLGMYGQLKKVSKYAPFDGRVEAAWQDARSFHPEGTMEILKNVVADRGLGLPRYSRPEGPGKPVTVKQG
ncbi:MAG: acyl-CoA dehydrogenase family protein [Dehalococcoidales bacterium]|nr:acyl-CoA dehydrogenase family protein [Dehalococcoidales bacterium]